MRGINKYSEGGWRMKRKFSVFVVILCCLMLLISSSIASAAEEREVEQKDIDKVVKALKGFKFGLLYYLSYQNGETGDLDDGTGTASSPSKEDISG